MLFSACTRNDVALPDAAEEPGSAGVTVERVAPRSALARAGLRAGDVVLRWRSADGVSGPLATPFDWHWLAVEHAPRGQLELTVRGVAETRRLRVSPGSWDADVRPALPEAALATYLEGLAEVTSGDARRGLVLWQEILDRSAAPASDEDRLSEETRAWLALRLSQAWGERREADLAAAALREASDLARDPRARRAVLEALGEQARRGRRFEDAEAHLRAARDGSEAESLTFAHLSNRLGGLYWSIGRPEAAEAPIRRALEIRERLAPESLELATSQNRLGALAFVRGRLDEAEGWYRAAYELRNRLVPESLELAGSLNNLGNTARDRGDLALATEHYGEALRLKQLHAPDSLDSALTLTNLGTVAALRGRHEEAEGFFQRALEIQRRLAPDSLEIARSLSNLANLEQNRGDLERAARYHEQALALGEALTPEGPQVALTLLNLGTVESEQGHRDRARRRLERSLGLYERLAPDGLESAVVLNNLGQMELEEGRLEAAEALHRRAREIYRRFAPRSRGMAFTLRYLGDVARAGSGPTGAATAEDFYREATDLFQEIAPESREAALAWHAYATLLRREGRDTEAADAFEAALRCLEAHIRHLRPSPNSGETFRARFQPIYRAAVETLLEMGRDEDAFALLERSRAQGFLALLAQRELRFTSDLPEELEQRRRRVADRRERTYDRLAQIRENMTANEVAAEALHDELRELRRQADDIAAQVRRAAPRLTRLRSPEPLQADAFRRALDSGTVSLTYSLGARRSHLFLVAAGVPLQTFTLDIGLEELRSEVAELRRLILESLPGSPLVDHRREALGRAARRLHDSLLGPALADPRGRQSLEGADRLLILPDGPLHQLPWGVLEHGGDSSRRGRLLVEWKPFHLSLSGTVFAELKRRRDDAEPWDATFAAFVNPSPTLAEPLPGSLREVASISALFPPEERRVFQGAEATELRLATLDARVRYLHFATHATLDERFPLQSAVLLAHPGELGHGNGRLQVWEILEAPPRAADLVVLSACGSALGSERDGEGLIGLTRAFQYAGARSVAASLWSVADETTAELMVRFYRRLAEGASKDLALRGAQLDLLTGPVKIPDADGLRSVDASAPYFWAAFQLYGDWR